MENKHLPSLSDLCLKSIYEKVKSYAEQMKDAESLEPPFKFKNPPFHSSRLEFKSYVFLPEYVSEKLITFLSTCGVLNDYTVSLFNQENTRIRHLKIPDASYLNYWSFGILKMHNLKELEIHKVHASFFYLVIESLNEWTLNNLEILNISSCSLVETYKMCSVLLNLTKLKNLKELDVSNTEFNFHNLDVIVEDLPNLESLNISHTRVDNITPLKKYTKRLKRLMMANLRLSYGNFASNVETYNDVLLNLTELRYLDISFERNNVPFDLLATSEQKYIFRIIESSDKLPNLISLDISGQEEINEALLVVFLRKHPNLKFLGLMSSDVCKSDIFSNPLNADYRPGLEVTGTGSLQQIILSMKLYEQRHIYIQKCLYNLYTFSERGNLGPRLDIIELVIKHMRSYRNELSIQIASTACLYNLTKCGWLENYKTDNISQILMSEVVELTLNAMELFPSCFQLQKNALLTLCNDSILQETKMDRFRCAKLVLNTFCQFNSEDTERLCVAISSVVASKISSKETTEIGSNRLYMNKLLTIVKQKLRNLTVDSTLGFALSTLWNLSDESPCTCSVFLIEGGMELFTKMLREYSNSESVLTKILGLLNNIAEVHTLRYSLMKKEIINSIRLLLHSHSIEISYFSAGVFAHLLSNDVNDWSVHGVSRHLVVQELETAILSWKQADKEMVAYRSFNPFLPLLRCYATYQAQLWAVWAIQHVLTAHAVRYYEMLTAEGICDVLEELACSPYTNILVRQRTVVILDQLNDFEKKKICTFKFKNSSVKCS